MPHSNPNPKPSNYPERQQRQAKHLRKKKTKPYGGSNAGGASIGGGA